MCVEWQMIKLCNLSMFKLHIHENLGRYQHYQFSVVYLLIVLLYWRQNLRMPFFGNRCPRPIRQECQHNDGPGFILQDLRRPGIPQQAPLRLGAFTPPPPHISIIYSTPRAPQQAPLLLGTFTPPPPLPAPSLYKISDTQGSPNKLVYTSRCV